MSRLRISDRRSISNLMRQDDPASRLVDRLDIHCRGRDTGADRIQVQLRGADAPPPAVEIDVPGAPEAGTDPDLADDAPGTGRPTRA